MEELLEFSIESVTNIDAISVLLSTVSATILALFIILVYRITYAGVAYNTNFAVSIGMITIITSLIMNVISNNIALSLGLVGALSIIRFRTVIKDIIDATYLFWAIAVGIACGVFQFVPAAIVSLNLVVFQLILKRFRKDGMYLLIIRSTNNDQRAIIEQVEQYFDKKLKQRIRSNHDGYGDVVYEVDLKNINLATKKRGIHIIDMLNNIKGVVSVDLVEHTENLMH